ncbi:hypothetical protein OPQ81_000540 [Rhizoctonia solani]|nr:hypothetical protein OPQ81_000540 [Rhizoctonia solani]
MTILLINKPNGLHTIKFAPDPENLGEVDAMEASDFTSQAIPPIKGYMALVNDRKRKHRDELTHVKCIQGGAEDVVDNEPQALEQPLPPPPPPTHPDTALAQVLQVIAASNAATQQLMAQMLEHMDNTANRQDPHTPNPRQGRPFRLDPLAGIASCRADYHNHTHY